MAGRRRTMLGVAAFVPLVVLSACGGGDSGPNSAEEDTHSFEYPEGWSELEAEFIAEAPNNTASVSVGPEETGVNLVTVGSFDVPVEVTSENLEQFRDDITAGVEQLFTQADGFDRGRADPHHGRRPRRLPVRGDEHHSGRGRRRGPHAVDPGLRRQDGLLHQLPVRAGQPGGDPGRLPADCRLVLDGVGGLATPARASWPAWP